MKSRDQHDTAATIARTSSSLIKKRPLNTSPLSSESKPKQHTTHGSFNKAKDSTETILQERLQERLEILQSNY